MITSFMWVIIGDLVSFHLQLIYGDKSGALHQPFTKTSKNDTQTFKVKDHNKDHSQKNKHYFSTTDNSTLLLNCFYKSQKTDKSLSILNYHLFRKPSLRGPPVLC